MPTGCSRRTDAPERGTAYRGRPPGQRSSHSSRRGHDRPRSAGKPCTGRRGAGCSMATPEGSTRDAYRRYCPRHHPKDATAPLGMSNWRAECRETGTLRSAGGRWKRADTVPRQRPTRPGHPADAGQAPGLRPGEGRSPPHAGPRPKLIPGPPKGTATNPQTSPSHPIRAWGISIAANRRTRSPKSPFLSANMGLQNQ